MPNLEHSPNTPGEAPGTGATRKTTRSGRTVRQPAHLRDFQIQGGSPALENMELGSRQRTRWSMPDVGTESATIQGRTNPNLFQNSELREALGRPSTPPTAHSASGGMTPPRSNRQPTVSFAHFPQFFNEPLAKNVSKSDIGEIVTQVVTSLMNIGVINQCNNNQTQSDIQHNNLVPKAIIDIKQLPCFEDNNNLHPIDFLQRLESALPINQLSYGEFCTATINLFKGKARLWADAFLATYSNYNQFKMSFNEHFWGADRQLQVKLQLEAGRYSEGPFVDHFNFYVCLAKHLQPPFSTNLLISTISRHFPPNISVLLIGAVTLEEALARLRQADYYLGSSRTNFQASLGNYRSGPLSGATENSKREQNKSSNFQNKFPSNTSYVKKNVSNLEFSSESVENRDSENE